MDFGKIIKREIDSSYVITLNGTPYHVPNESEWADGSAEVQYAAVHAYAQANPGLVTIEAAEPLAE